MHASVGTDLTRLGHWRSQGHEIDRRSMNVANLKSCWMDRFSVCGFEGMWNTYARVAQLVEYNLAKVGVAGSSPVSRSSKCMPETFVLQGFPAFSMYLVFEDR